MKLFVLADDMTGTLDTAIKFVDAGLKTRAAIDSSYDFTHEDADVLVMNTATRHLSAEEAYQRVFTLTKKAAETGVEHLYKKVDSSLRGNIGAELSAMLEASGEKSLSFIPAFPSMGRVTREGIHYVDGLPVDQSVFGSDPFESVTASYIPDIIAKQSKVPAAVFRFPEQAAGEGIHVYDCTTDEEMNILASGLALTGGLRVVAGCAGFAQVLSGHLGLESTSASRHMPAERLLVLCGSVNPITRKQIQKAAQEGFRELLLEDAGLPGGVGVHEFQLARDLWQKGSPMMIVTSDSGLPEGEALSKARQDVADNLGNLLAKLLDNGLRATLLITGGDTLLAVLKRLGIESLKPLYEIAPGAVYSVFNYQGRQYDLISKAGGFGSETFFTDMNQRLFVQEGEKV